MLSEHISRQAQAEITHVNDRGVALATAIKSP
jgi:hypothetical protein